jgi:predicted Fe-S protein YdhL (DUF1289 family)
MEGSSMKQQLICPGCSRDMTEDPEVFNWPKYPEGEVTICLACNVNATSKLPEDEAGCYALEFPSVS